MNPVPARPANTNRTGYNTSGTTEFFLSDRISICRFPRLDQPNRPQPRNNPHADHRPDDAAGDVLEGGGFDEGQCVRGRSSLAC
mgnify:CR=1 FL=1